jgi:hypothetical protein
MCHIRQMEPLDTNNMNIKKLICLLFLVSTAFAQSVYTGNPVMTNTGQPVMGASVSTCTGANPGISPEQKCSGSNADCHIRQMEPRN